MRRLTADQIHALAIAPLPIIRYHGRRGSHASASIVDDHGTVGTIVWLAAREHDGYAPEPPHALRAWNAPRPQPARRRDGMIRAPYHRTT